MAVRDLKHCVVRLVDGTPTTPLTLSIKIGDGTISHSEAYNREYVMDRGLLDTVRDGDETPMDVSIDAQFEYYKGTTGAITPRDALLGENSASAWISSDTADPCAPYCVDIEVIYTPPCADGEIETTTYPHFRVEKLDFDHKAGTLSISGKCNAIAPTSVREEP